MVDVRTVLSSSVDAHKPDPSHGSVFHRARRDDNGQARMKNAAMVLATLKTFTLGPLQLLDVPAEFHSSGAGSFRTLRQAGLVGAGILGRFRVIFDRPHDAMYLLPPPDGARPTFPKDRAGLQTYFRGRYLEILFVAPGSPGEAGGWKTGDHITAIDRSPIAPSYPALPAWQSRPPGTTVVLKDGKGRIRPLTLRDYY
jgi:hypothetical protein